LRTHHGGILSVWAFTALIAPSVTRAQSFSPAPLSVPIAFPRDSLPVTAPAFMDWLTTHGPPGLPGDAQQIREHVYALIAQIIKQRFASTHSLDLPTGDTTLTKLFLWGDRLGVPGAAEVARAIGGDSVAPVTPSPSRDLQLTLAGSMFSLVAVKGKWMVHFPYFFMVGTLARQKLNNGIENDIAMLSTLTAANSEPLGGASQATIIVVSAQTADLPSYVAFWLQQLQIAPSDTASNPVPRATRSYRIFDPVSRLWKEIVAFTIPSGSLIVAYIGLDGTYQANRPHFLDLLASLRVRE
jgi:hypothetical protein